MVYVAHFHTTTSHGLRCETIRCSTPERAGSRRQKQTSHQIDCQKLVPVNAAPPPIQAPPFSLSSWAPVTLTSPSFLPSLPYPTPESLPLMSLHSVRPSLSTWQVSPHQSLAVTPPTCSPCRLTDSRLIEENPTDHMNIENTTMKTFETVNNFFFCFAIFYSNPTNFVWRLQCEMKQMYLMRVNSVCHYLPDTEQETNQSICLIIYPTSPFICIYLSIYIVKLYC